MSQASPLKIYSLPLFPLNHVLFPHFLLQLHVFEGRYRVMINECIERNEPFGVVLIREGSEVGAPAVPYEVGCAARILAVKRLDDGRMHLLAIGEQRFRLLDYVEADLPYLIGQVEAVEDAVKPQDDMPYLIGEATEKFERYRTLLMERASIQLPDSELPDDPALLAFYIASVVPLSSLTRQNLLEMTDARLRLIQEIALLEEQLAELETLQAGAEEESEQRVLVAKPIDSEEEAWKAFRHEARN